MEKLTEDFIRHIKKAQLNHKEAAIQFMMDYTGSPRESYKLGELYDIVKSFFLDYLKTGDACEAMQTFFRVRGYQLNLMTDNSGWTTQLKMLDCDIECMLSAMVMARVMKDGKLVNGFTQGQEVMK
jgi:hypothetical protein